MFITIKRTYDRAEDGGPPDQDLTDQDLKQIARGSNGFSFQADRKTTGLQSPTQQTQVTYLLLAVLVLALGLRVWGITFGLPYDFTYDEVHEVVRVFKLSAGEYDWNGFGKGGGYITYSLPSMLCCMLYIGEGVG
jgi:hypothetical protein